MADGTELGYCLPCDHACSTCNGASPRDCITCSSGHLHLQEVCVTRCPAGYKFLLLGNDLQAAVNGEVLLLKTRFPVIRYYTDGSRCQRCNPSCELCTGPGHESCRTCLPPLLELPGTNLCVEHCPQRFYQLGDICRRCHTSCQTCTGAKTLTPSY